MVPSDMKSFYTSETHKISENRVFVADTLLSFIVYGMCLSRFNNNNNNNNLDHEI